MICALFDAGDSSMSSSSGIAMPTSVRSFIIRAKSSSLIEVRLGAGTSTVVYLPDVTSLSTRPSSLCWLIVTASIFGLKLEPRLIWITRSSV
jgi:hypothetical protein